MPPTSDQIDAFLKKATAPGSFYDQNGGRFRNQERMTPEQERAYIVKLMGETT